MKGGRTQHGGSQRQLGAVGSWHWQAAEVHPLGLHLSKKREGGTLALRESLDFAVGARLLATKLMG